MLDELPIFVAFSLKMDPSLYHSGLKLGLETYNLTAMKNQGTEFGISTVALK